MSALFVAGVVLPYALCTSCECKVTKETRYGADNQGLIPARDDDYFLHQQWSQSHSHDMSPGDKVEPANQNGCIILCVGNLAD
jgi:hypothetical protein